MARQPGDDLFSDSVMSFGEHLEELRMALARALVGLVIGVAIGFWFADDVVRLIESPLKDALRVYHAQRAVEKYTSGLEPEQLTLIERAGVAPESVLVEVPRLLEHISQSLPGAINESVVNIAHVSDKEMEQVDVRSVCSTLMTGVDNPDLPVGVLWKHLTSEQQQLVRETASAESVSDSQRSGVQAILNALIDTDSLRDAPVFADVSELFSGERLRGALKSFQATVAQSGTPLSRHRLNRWIVTGVLAPDVPQPRPDVIALPMWKTVDAQIITLNAQEAFMVWFKAAFLTGFMIASPWVFWQIWMFVAAGLYPHEKGYVYTFLPFSLLLFAAGAALAFFAVFPFVLDFLFKYNRQLDIVPNLRLSEWLGLALLMPIGFGVSFQLPLVMLLLERIGVFTIEAYTSKWRISVLVICVISMVLTPAEPMSMIMMAVPLIFLYFGGIGLCRWMPRRESPFGAAFDP